MSNRNVIFSESVKRHCEERSDAATLRQGSGWRAIHSIVQKNCLPPVACKAKGGRVATLLAMTIMTLMLTSCSGFKPLYAKDKDLLSKIEIEEMNTVGDSEIYHSLVSLIGNGENSEYLLKIKTVSTSVSPLAITGHADVVKQNITNMYHYSLIQKKDGTILTSGQIRAVGSYDSLLHPYATYTNEKFVEKNLSQTVAQDIYMRLVLYFSRLR